MIDVWQAPPPPRCPVHGQMRLDNVAGHNARCRRPLAEGMTGCDLCGWANPGPARWTCAGWDGEGCDWQVRDQDRDRAYTRLGAVHPGDPFFGPGVVLACDWAQPL